MAFRIEDSVVRGEIDNRVKGIVRGKIWLEGRPDPMLLELKGNPWPDLAGCLLTFVNPNKRIPYHSLDALGQVQRGAVGDMTASRKVRVLEVPVAEAYMMAKRGEKPPEHMANSLYLEWFSETNGRVVIESSDYELNVSQPEWRMTPEDEVERAKQAATAMQEFMARLTDAVEQHKRRRKPDDEDWDQFDYESFMKECDARSEKYAELLDEYGLSDEAQDIIDKEMGWDTEPGEELFDEITDTFEEALNEPEPEPDPTRQGIDWIRTKDGHIRHPLQHRCHQSAAKFSNKVKRLGLDRTKDKDLDQFLFEFQMTAVKLAGALNTVAQARYTPPPAFTVAYLKRALDHLHKSQAGLEGLAKRKVLADKLISSARKELFAIRESVLKLMNDFRRKQR
ncbi:MAG: hypothetical protein GX456_01150 [Verrucomicrobia bacterium]|nr:hypothetical protein [Verrucomicrobiota bacterium]